jgi:hypothetical protein
MIFGRSLIIRSARAVILFLAMAYFLKNRT